MNNGKRIPYYTCSTYSKVPIGTLCDSAHRINAGVVMTLVADMLRAIMEYSKKDRPEFVRAVTEAQETQRNGDISAKKKRLSTARKRTSELETLICKIYEDSVLGKLTEVRYAALDEQYEKEQEVLSREISELEAAIDGYERSWKSAAKFIALVEKYENFDTMTTVMLNEFVEKIKVHKRERNDSLGTKQHVEIFFNFVGRYVPPRFGEVVLTAKEQEDLRKREARKDKLRQNYLQRKESGKVKEYVERTKADRKAKLDAKKDALRAEDIAKGVFIPMSKLPKANPKIAGKTA
jgi:hypothetical protein